MSGSKYEGLSVKDLTAAARANGVSFDVKHEVRLEINFPTMSIPPGLRKQVEQRESEILAHLRSRREPEYYYQQAPADIDTEFYTLYDPQILLSKALVLWAALEDREVTKATLEAKDSAGIGAVIDEKCFAALAAELHFTRVASI